MLCHNLRNVAVHASHMVEHGRGMNMVYWKIMFGFTVIILSNCYNM